MKIEELIQLCQGGGFVTLVIKGSLRPSQTTKRFMGRKGPVGEVVCEYEDNRCLVAFKSEEVLRFVKKELLVHDKRTQEEE